MVALVPVALPEPKDELLPRSPLRLVGFQLRHTPTETVQELSVGLAAQQRLGGQAIWRLEPIQSQTLSVRGGLGQPGLSQSIQVQPTGWRLTAEDSTATVAISADSVGLEATSYPGWPVFRQAIDALIRLCAEVTHPAAELRLGLRYINRLEDPAVTTPTDWRRWIDSRVLGLLLHQISDGILAAQEQLDVRLDDGSRATIQHGFLRDQASGRWAYLMDFDTYREGARPFDAQAVRTAVENLHRQVLQLFQSMITPELYEYLRRDVNSS